MIKSVSTSQDEVLSNIMTLYCPNGFDLDPTYSKGVFYKHLPPPKWKSDLHPQFSDVMECDCKDLPFEDNSLSSIMFDPPFLGGGKPSDKSIIMNRFGSFKNVPELWEFYSLALDELVRILKPGGILVFKCQDTVNSQTQWLSHVKVINLAVRRGLYPLDLFVLLANSRLIDNRWKNQEHARKYHSYFLVFQKVNKGIDYDG